MVKYIDLTGQQFGRLTVLEKAPNSLTTRGTRWICKCECGAKKIISGHSMRNGTSKSCGCWNADSRRTHNATFLPGYHIWVLMRIRCYDKKSVAYKWYGGRGITICERWLDSPNAFIDDMGPRPSTKHTVDRIDNNGPYSPDNCRWTTNRVQTRNARYNNMVTIDGRTMCCLLYTSPSPRDA